MERSTAAPLFELFASIQGEGRHAGRPQLFLRLRGCPLRCRWCDTPGSWRLAAEDRARLATPEGERDAPASTTPEQAARLLLALDPGGARAVSVTGGEPCVWPEFLLALRAALDAACARDGRARRRLHLETGGGHPRALARLAGAFEHLSVDLKLPADLDAPEELDGLDAEPAPRDAAEWRAARRACLDVLREHPDACAKLVVAGGRALEDFAPLLEDLRERAPAAPLYLQPVTPTSGVARPERALLQALLERALERGLDARVLPQVHRALGLR